MWSSGGGGGGGSKVSREWLYWQQQQQWRYGVEPRGRFVLASLSTSKVTPTVTAQGDGVTTCHEQ